MPQLPIPGIRRGRNTHLPRLATALSRLPEGVFPAQALHPLATSELFLQSRASETTTDRKVVAALALPFPTAPTPAAPGARNGRPLLLLPGQERRKNPTDLAESIPQITPADHAVRGYLPDTARARGVAPR